MKTIQTLVLLIFIITTFSNCEKFEITKPIYDIVFSARSNQGVYNIYRIKSDGSSEYSFNLLSSLQGYIFLGNWNENRSELCFIASSSNNSREIYAMGFNSSATVQLTTNNSIESYPNFSPNGLELLFIKGSTLYLADVNGVNEKSIYTIPSSGSLSGCSWFPDGSKIIFSVNNLDGNKIYTMNKDGSNVEELVSSESLLFNPKVSPNGQRVAYTTRENTFSVDNESHLMTIDVDGSNQKIIKTVKGSIGTVRHPSWSPDGTRIVFISNDNAINSSTAYIISFDGSDLYRLTSDNSRHINTAIWVH